MRDGPVIRALACVAAAFCLSGSPAQRGASAPGFYQIIDLGTLGGLTSVALGINNLGQVVGGADLPDGTRHAFLWENGVMTDLGTLGSDRYSEAWDINNLGVVCGGSSFSTSSWRPFVWEAGTMTQLPHLSGQPGGDSNAYALNDSAQVVGSSLAPGDTHAVLWENGTVTDLGTLGGSYSIAWDINSSGQIVGIASTGGPPGGAFLWSEGVMTNLGTLGGAGSEAWGINDAAQVAGRALRPDNNVAHAFFWEAGTMTDITASTAFDASFAYAVNVHGHVAGVGSIAPLGYPFVYVPGIGLRNLEPMLPAGHGWSDLIPRDINDGGQIVGWGIIGKNAHAFLMTPAPVPTVSALGIVVLAASLVFFGCILVRRAGL
ncbi:MAG: HAF repeat-containing protein [Planctomycetes bacterium]|nr:HAF repeat-containing protein [Planctomycetota bacterium]